MAGKGTKDEATAAAVRIIGFLLEITGWSPAQLATKMDVAHTTITRPYYGKSNYTLSYSTIFKAVHATLLAVQSAEVKKPKAEDFAALIRLGAAFSATTLPQPAEKGDRD